MTGHVLLSFKWFAMHLKQNTNLKIHIKNVSIVSMQMNGNCCYVHSSYPDTRFTVGILQSCKHIGQIWRYRPAAFAFLPVITGASGLGSLVKLPLFVSFCHHWMNCRKNADNSKTRNAIPVKRAECRKFIVNKSDHVHSRFVSVGKYTRCCPTIRFKMECVWLRFDR